MTGIGEIPEPGGFRYREILLKGKPQHEGIDAFSIRHPRMDVGKRAKIFAPFDALKGFDEALASKDVLYEEQRDPDEEIKAELDRRLEILRKLCRNSRTARASRAAVTVTYFAPCPDPESEAHGSRGQYRQLTGICMGVDPELTQTIRIDDRRIPLADLLRIESAQSPDIFDRESPDTGLSGEPRPCGEDA